MAAMHRVRIVMRADRDVVTQAHRHALVATVHGNEIDVHIHEEIALDGTAIESHPLAMICLSDLDNVIEIFGVVIVQAVRVIFVIDFRADDLLDLWSSHMAMETDCDDDMNIIDSVFRTLLKQLREYELAQIRALHRW